MNLKKAIRNIFIAIIIIVIILLTVAIIHSTVKSCISNDIYTNITSVTNTSQQVCWYAPDIYGKCRDTDLTYQNFCYYKKKGFFETSQGKWSLIILGIVLFIVLISFIIYKIIKVKPLGQEIKIVDRNKALELYKEHWSLENDIPIIIQEDKIILSKSLYSITKEHIFVLNNEWFIQFQIEWLSGKRQGTYTIIISLSKGEDYILKGNYSSTRASWDYADFKERTRPLNAPKRPEEQYYDKLLQSQPELAQQFLEQKTNKEIESMFKPTTTQQEEQTQTQQETGAPDVYPAFKQRYKSRRYRRW